ncbi:hypothetical protein [Curtobacterium sp. ISL-83]|uniref:hypothetical protein n=1 Tax=Curtobacterium sp. ISL-83 TaxID=2819145 RepID=UPI001BE681DD|nr:hypothetical protein [Curtobacterium sp. ISL-83]MBT2503003.1 hypothetical protein [Curtobacterium sp. ISL-83]
MSTPIDRTPNTPLDSLKTATLRAIDDISTVTDTLAGTCDLPDDHAVMAILDRLSHLLKVIVAEHVPGVTVPDDGLLTAQQQQLLNTYDNGQPVKVSRSIGGHVVYDIWPRVDTQLDALRTSTHAADLAQRMEAEGIDN